MEHLDYLPFLQFIRDDKETVEIMQKALTIIPKVCDFLDGNLEAFNPRSGGGSSSGLSLTPGVMPPLLLPSSSENRLTSRPETSRDSLPRKRKQSIRDTPSESTSVVQAHPSTSTGLPIPKKARVLNPRKSDIQIRPPTRSRPSDLPTVTQIRERLQEDYDKFVRQIGELAALEREKNRLLGKFLSVSAIASGSASSESSSTSDTSTSDD